MAKLAAAAFSATWLIVFMPCVQSEELRGADGFPIGIPGGRADHGGNSDSWGPPLLYSHPYALAGAGDPLLAAPWIDPVRRDGGVIAVSYQWGRTRLEGSAFSLPSQDYVPPTGAERPFSLDSKVARLSFKPADNWTLRLSRGTLGSLDQLVPNDEVRRTALSATYRLPLQDGEWQSTVAWGRNARRYRDPTTGYLLESMFRFNGGHTVFGRLEQTGSDELLRGNEASVGKNKLNRLTVGYFHEIRAPGSLNFDVGVFAARYFVPSDAAQSYGSNPMSCMMFIRLKLQ
jgi:hypothetical protein